MQFVKIRICQPSATFVYGGDGHLVSGNSTVTSSGVVTYDGTKADCGSPVLG